MPTLARSRPTSPLPAAIWQRPVVTAGEDRAARHVFAPALHVHESGDYLLVCRYDASGSREGDASNAQALFVSRDAGQTWAMANRRHPIITLDHGTSFPAPSAITHAWFLPGADGILSLIYSINQPFTWGADDPNRSTGGGEIRRLELHHSTNGDWHSASTSTVVWPFQAPLPDGCGGTCHDIRAVSWNGAVRTNAGTWLMPIGGRASGPEPRGESAPLNRVWLLRSIDDGRTWGSPVFIAGGDDRAFAEPTLVATSDPQHFVCLLRVQYDTGHELYRTVSEDGGQNWSPPTPTGLPNADTQGAKPFLFRDATGDFWLAQTNEHVAIARTNIALFHTNEAGLLTDCWQHVRTLDIGNRSGWWPGSCYGWLAEDIGRSRLLVAYATATPEETQLRFSAFDRAHDFFGPTVEPNGVRDEIADDRPQPFRVPGEPPQLPSYRLVSTRSRLIATHLLNVGPQPLLISFSLVITALPESATLHLLRLGNRHGRDPVFDLWLTPAAQLDAELFGQSNPLAPLRCGAHHKITCTLHPNGPTEVQVDDHSFLLPQIAPAHIRSAALQWGGGPVAREACDLSIEQIHYHHPA